VRCWGNNGYRQMPGTGMHPDLGGNEASLHSFRSISAGNFFTCGIREDFTLFCWGSYQSVFRETHAPSGLFSTVSSGADFACGIELNSHKVKCWGRNDKGQCNAPLGEFVEITTGFDHACGLRKSNNTMQASIECWGDDNFGQGSSTDCNGIGRRCFWGSCDTSPDSNKCPISWPLHFLNPPESNKAPSQHPHEEAGKEQTVEKVNYFGQLYFDRPHSYSVAHVVTNQPYNATASAIASQVPDTSIRNTSTSNSSVSNSSIINPSISDTSTSNTSISTFTS